RSTRDAALGGRLAAPAGPLAAPGREPEVAAALGRALAAATPRVSQLVLEGLASQRWPQRLAEGWPRRRGWVLRAESRPLPVVAVGGLDYDGWLAGKTSNFRNQARRLRRRLEEAGASFGLVGAAGVATALEEFERLHGDRRDRRDGSNALVAGLQEMLADLAGDGLESGRLRIFRLAAGGEAVAVTIALAAGGQVDAWNSGFDEDWYKLSPSQQLLLYAIEDTIGRGESRIRLGAGDAAYKLRLADELDAVARDSIVPRGGAYPLTRLRLAPAQARRFAGDRLSDEAKARLRSLAKRS
ncbi:MAG: GNAT family N-acetyltransferase, partial [Solirubrobacterales bacterium]